MKKFRLLDGTVIEVPDHFPSRQQLNHRAEKGDAWLERMIGPWIDDIDLEMLDQETYRFDVVGQLAHRLQRNHPNPDYFTVLSAGIISKYQGSDNIFDLAFSIDIAFQDADGYAILTDVWKRYIIKKRKADAEKTSQPILPEVKQHAG